MKNIRIEKLDNSPIEGTGFVAVYVNENCVGTCLKFENSSAEECLEQVKNNQEIDRLETIEDEKIINSLDY